MNNIYTLFITILFLLSGCVASYQHQSDPRISNDGYDLICGGVEHDINSIRLRGDICHNLARNRGEMIRIAVEYRFRRSEINLHIID